MLLLILTVPSAKQMLSAWTNSFMLLTEQRSKTLCSQMWWYFILSQVFLRKEEGFGTVDS